MLVLISRSEALQQACDLALTGLAFGQEVTIILWPEPFTALAQMPGLCQRLSEFGLNELDYLSTAQAPAPQASGSLPGIVTRPLNKDALPALLKAEHKVISF